MSIYTHDCYLNYLNSTLGASKASYNGVARKLGYKSHKSVTDILNGKRAPSQRLALSISSYLNHDDAEHKYFELLIERKKAIASNADARVRRALEEKILEMRSHRINKNQSVISSFKHLSEWYVLPIKQLISRGDFKLDSNWISQQLNYKITKSQVESAINILIQEKIVKRIDDVNIELVKPGVSSTDDKEDDDIKKYHSQYLNRAKEALYNQPVQDREFRVATLKIPKSRLKEMKLEIRKTLEEIAYKYHLDDEKEIYQLGIQLCKTY